MSHSFLFVLGAGGHAHALLAVLYRYSVYRKIGLIDSLRHGEGVAHGFPILGNESDLPGLCTRYNSYDIIVAIGDNLQRQAATRRLKRSIPKAAFPALVDPSAVVAADAQLGPGVVVMAQAHVGAGCVLKEGVILNTKSSIDHDSSMEPFASLAPGAITGGCVRIGARSFIGLGSQLIQGIQIGHDTVVGAGALVLKELPHGVLAYGAPAHVVRSRRVDEPYI